MIDTNDFGSNEWFIEAMREQFESDPDSVPPEWARLFTPPVRPAAAAGEPPQETPPAPPVPAAVPTPVPAEPPARVAPAPAVAVEPSQPRSAETPQTPEAGLSANPDDPTIRPVTKAPAAERTPIRGAALKTAHNMDDSVGIPVATSVRNVPMKLVIDLREQMNNHLQRTRGGKVSFTHIVGYAMVKALMAVDGMNVFYQADGGTFVVSPRTVNLGLAVDRVKPDGTRQLMVPVIKRADTLDFAQFVAAYEDLVKRTFAGKLTVDDLTGATVTLTNPGTIGTSHSIPRLMKGQGLILGVGSIDYAPGFKGASPARLSDMGISKVMTLTSTYDHRVIQGAQSGEFLRYIEELLIGQHHFFRGIFEALRIPYAPLTWDTDIFTTRQNQVSKTARVVELVNSYRTLGHLMADIDPLLYRLRSHPDLELATHGLTLWDLDREFAVGTLGGENRQLTSLRKILTTVQDAYCRTVGVEYMHIVSPEQREWLRARLEAPWQRFEHGEHMRILDRLNEAEIFETFLQKKFVGQKRFSLEGGESTIVILDQVCSLAAEAGLDEVCIGMSHRGRLNVLANIAGKSYAQIFQEFEEGIEPASGTGSGDVKYHLGAQGRFTAHSGAGIDVSVAANPSHLETVDPVLEGIARAKQDLSRSDTPFPVLPILVHGDAAMSGQGVVYETMQMSQLRAYSTGGTVHLVINNQIGFTTAPIDSRSSTYCTDVAKVVQAPVFHVNGDDPDACVRVASLAYAYREAFHKDVVIDLVCYRRRGHNEGDDPSFTQPVMYDLIAKKRSVRALYTEALIGRGDISLADAAGVEQRFGERLEAVFDDVRQTASTPVKDADYVRRPRYPSKHGLWGSTAVDETVMSAIADAHLRFPAGFTVHPRVLTQLQRRADAIRQGPVDWATAEMLAFGSLLLEGRRVRVVGQDSRRGTFSQRFGAVVDRVSNEAYVPLKHITATQGPFDIFDSLLSEYAGLGFEYGYSVAAPEALVAWEAQFGDFANTAQAVIDEFISSGDAKWQQRSGVVLLLPHGYDGQGPDHSSARLERWFQLCSQNALTVAQPSTPANYFHLLRAHAYAPWHRPLVVATPKSMLRNKHAVSAPDDFTRGAWRPVLADETVADQKRVASILLCSGKLRWELIEERARRGRDGQVAIISIEQFYPIPAVELATEFAKYPQVADIRYVQEEPENQGGWLLMEKFIPQEVEPYLHERTIALRGICRPSSCAPDVGSHHDHESGQKALLESAFE
ncbi:MAG: multifunctional oxoglutarate decarboxylase/oxoglutarate dehydrogenase thiamine pyrophosphate-binding subunit/dihydrolipoyllysine-residue succinyltransferase subunit [Propionibacteriaceae bacterium]|jgi:2-oxoglutarate dehydrogenase E1 component|nr:multifunctional oxoglutarate decarboxylase/oxoglutarate dehydrogenase thiamine pyrophosphate-binding subunit/dihydrolipoyllysine-residue succinyltransferase subunit [Propionibacteriaceae bacterium]